MFRNNFFVICLLVAGGSSLISAQVQPMMPMDAEKLIPGLAPKDAVPAKEATIETTTVVASTTTPSTNLTTTPSPTKPTTPEPTTTKPTTPKTTTTKPTTAKPTTPTPITTSTTPGTTTTSAPITTTPAPNPVPIPEPPMGRWNTTCILLQMATQLNFTYETADNKTARAIYNIPATATVHDVSCEYNTTQELVLTWGPETAVHSIAIYFNRTNDKVHVQLISITLPIDAEEFNNPKANQSVQLMYRGDIFEVPSHMSYHCTRPQIFNVTESVIGGPVLGTMRLSDIQLEAFRQDNSTIFSSARDCDSSETPDIVPIAVGIALVALILIVLISYLCARRRNNARGYMSF